MGRKFLYLPEVAERLNRSIRAVEWLVNSKQLPSGKLAGRRVVAEDALEKFIDDAFVQSA